MQLLGHGPLTALAPGRRVWLDGGHNADAGQAIGRIIAGPVHLVIGQLANKDPAAIVGPLRGKLASLSVVPVPGHEAHDAAAFGKGARAFRNVTSALGSLPPEGDVLIAGSLYLAGEVLRLNSELPD
jgi:dihydrofolate synthase/folylpolyglutamate synthase